jgi:hypothetical protein
MGAVLHADGWCLTEFSYKEFDVKHMVKGNCLKRVTFADRFEAYAYFIIRELEAGEELLAAKRRKALEKKSRRPLK